MGGQSRTNGHNQHNAARPSGTDDPRTHRTTTPHNTKENTTTHNNARRHQTRRNTAQTARHSRAPGDNNKNGAANAHGSRPAKKPTTQHDSTPNNKAPAHQHITAQKNTAKHTKQPTPDLGTTQQDAGHRTTPGATAGGGGGTAPAHNAHTTRKRGTPMEEKETLPNGAKAKGTKTREPANSGGAKKKKQEGGVGSHKAPRHRAPRAGTNGKAETRGAQEKEKETERAGGQPRSAEAHGSQGRKQRKGKHKRSAKNQNTTSAEGARRGPKEIQKGNRTGEAHHPPDPAKTLQPHTHGRPARPTRPRRCPDGRLQPQTHWRTQPQTHTREEPGVASSDPKGEVSASHETAPVHRPSPPSRDGRYGKPDA